jgi:D-alanine-D-alanine ligase-like ATP-grasp enzyme
VASLQNIWKKLHTPYIIRPIDKKKNTSVIVLGFDQFMKEISRFHKLKEDIIVMSYRNTTPFSIAVLPNYRGEKLYAPLGIQTLSGKYEIPNKNHKKVPFLHLSLSEKQKIMEIAKEAHQALGLNGHILVDIIKTPKGYMVVELETRPSLLEDSRFSQSLATTGADIGHYIHSCLENAI